MQEMLGALGEAHFCTIFAEALMNNHIRCLLDKARSSETRLDSESAIRSAGTPHKILILLSKRVTNLGCSFGTLFVDIEGDGRSFQHAEC